MSDQHSPGPWKVFPSGTSAPGYDVCDRIISDNWTGRSQINDGMADTDARLIAAAPDLLEALKLLYREMELSGNLGSKQYGWPEATTKAQAAIAKATGDA